MSNAILGAEAHEQSYGWHRKVRVRSKGKLIGKLMSGAGEVTSNFVY